jgi:hypothetical protein
MTEKEQQLIAELRRAPNLKVFLDYLAEKESKLISWKYAGEANIKLLQGKAQLIDEIKQELTNGR